VLKACITVQGARGAGADTALPAYAARPGLSLCGAGGGAGASSGGRSRSSLFQSAIRNAQYCPAGRAGAGIDTSPRLAHPGAQ
jgi:hypothetical protein